MTPAELSVFVSGSIVLTAIVVAATIVFGVMGLARRPGVFSEGPDDLAGVARIARVDRWAVLLVAGAGVAALLVTYLLGGRSPILGLLYIFGLAPAGYGDFYY